MDNKRTTEFIEKAKSIHGNFYEYSNVCYVNNITKVAITCHKHGIFEQIPKNHLAGKGCPKCPQKGIKSDRFDFIRKAKSIHGKHYSYRKVRYRNNKKPVIITCKEHGDFEQRPQHHLDGNGCPYCKSVSSGEALISVLLQRYGITFKQEYPLCKNSETGYYLRADFYIPHLNMVIEYDGKQHFKPVDYFGGQEHYEACIYRDSIKNQYCSNNSIRLLRIPYFHKKYLKKIIEKRVVKHYYKKN